MDETTSPKKKSKNFYSYILSSIKKFSYPIKIANSLNISKQQLNYYIQTLKQHGCIKKISQGAWIYIKDFDEKRVKKSKKINLGSLQQPPLFLKEKDVRGHAFMFHLKLPKIKKWNKRKEYLDKYNIKYSPLKFGQKIIVKGRIIHLFQDSIIIYDRESYISELARETKSLAIYNFISLIKTIENIFKISFEIKKQYKFKVCREHYALIKNCMARQYNKEGKKLEVYNSSGLWLLIDNSFNLNELETLKNRETVPDQAVSDNEGVQNYFNSHKNTNFQVTPEFILNAINKVTQNQVMFNNNHESHLKVINKLGLAVDELRKEIKKRNI